ncbi:MAG TPA: anti-sigma regulatory factor [Actinomycetota bacterium]|nr:anti-sigma regulatory factor [Actinomycetota bacterium]
MDTVSINIPASPVYLRVVRLVAAGLASRLRFTIDEIDDLKIAVDELSAYLTGAQGREGNLEIRFLVYDDRIEIHGLGQLTPGQKVRTELTDMSRMILETLVDSASLEQKDGTPEFVLVKSKAP